MGIFGERWQSPEGAAKPLLSGVRLGLIVRDFGTTQLRQGFDGQAKAREMARNLECGGSLPAEALAKEGASLRAATPLLWRACGFESGWAGGGRRGFG